MKRNKIAPREKKLPLTEKAWEILFNAVFVSIFGLLMYIAYDCIYLDICEKLTR